MEAELKLSKSQQVRAMAKLSVQKSKAEQQLASIKEQLLKLSDDKSSLFREVGSLESQLAQAHADREEARNWAATYRDMLLKVMLHEGGHVIIPALKDDEVSCTA